MRDGSPGSGLVRPPERLTDEEIRQMRSEARERAQDAEALRRELGEAGVDTGDLSELVRALRALDDQRIYGDLGELARLQGQLVEASKRFEYALRRELDPTMGERPRLTGTEEIPEGYRRWVEEYYRSLSRGGGR